MTTFCILTTVMVIWLYTFVKILELLALKVCTFLKITKHIKNFKGVSYTINLCDFVNKRDGKAKVGETACVQIPPPSLANYAVIQSKPVHVWIPSLNGDHRSTSQGGQSEKENEVKARPESAFPTLPASGECEAGASPALGAPHRGRTPAPLERSRSPSLDAPTPSLCCD